MYDTSCPVSILLKSDCVLQACMVQLGRHDFLMERCSVETRLNLAVCDWAADKSQVAEILHVSVQLLLAAGGDHAPLPFCRTLLCGLHERIGKLNRGAGSWHAIGAEVLCRPS
jgi:hypothetical protein